MFYIVLLIENEQGDKVNRVCYDGDNSFITSIHLAALNFKTQLEERFPKAKYQVAEVTPLLD